MTGGLCRLWVVTQPGEAADHRSKTGVGEPECAFSGRFQGAGDIGFFDRVAAVGPSKGGGGKVIVAGAIGEGGGIDGDGGGPGRRGGKGGGVDRGGDRGERTEGPSGEGDVGLDKVGGGFIGGKGQRQTGIVGGVAIAWGVKVAV